MQIEPQKAKGKASHKRHQRGVSLLEVLFFMMIPLSMIVGAIVLFHQASEAQRDSIAETHVASPEAQPQITASEAQLQITEPESKGDQKFDPFGRLIVE